MSTTLSPTRFTTADVRDLLELVNDTAFEFDELLEEPTPQYYTDWLFFYQRSTQAIKKPGNTWKAAALLHPSLPDSWHDYVEAVLRLVPPVQAVLTIQTSTKDTVTLRQLRYTDAVLRRQKVLHCGKVTLSVLEKSIRSSFTSFLKELSPNVPAHYKQTADIEPPSSDEESDKARSPNGSCPILCRSAKFVAVTTPVSKPNRKEPGLNDKNEFNDESEEAYMSKKDGMAPPNTGSDDTKPHDRERSALLAEGLDNEEIDDLFEEDDMNALLSKAHSKSFSDDDTLTTQNDCDSFHNETSDGNYGNSYYDSGYHDGYKEGITEIASDDGYSTGYDHGYSDHESDYPSDYYSDDSYTDDSYNEAPD